MKGDFTRLVAGQRTYSRVLMQQGRTLVDTDWNVLVGILTDAHRLFIADVLGPHGGPADDLGFQITSTDDPTVDLQIGVGTYYVDGIRVTNTAQDGETTTRYSEQGFGPDSLRNRPYVVYLDAWERHLTSLEDDSIREVALGGPDTTSRAEVLAQVKVLGLADGSEFGNDCNDFALSDFRAALFGRRPTMKARCKKPDISEDNPCVSPPDARFRGTENQLYRVEIHASDDGDATFVWSRENGSVVAAWLATDGEVLQVTGIRDKVHGFQPGDWVELSDDVVELRGEHGVLVRLAAVDGDELTMDTVTATGPIEADPSRLVNAKVRRWDQKEWTSRPLKGGAVPLEPGDTEAGWIPLEDGVEVQFTPGDAGQQIDYRVGDYWVFPARVATGDIEWPQEPAGDGPSAIPPFGVEHHYAPLALVTAAGDVFDLRHSFSPLTTCANW